MLAVSLHATTDEVRREGGTEGGSGKGPFDRGVGLVPSIDQFVEEMYAGRVAAYNYRRGREGGREGGRRR